MKVYLELGDHLGSTSNVLDFDSGAVVEKVSYQAYGGADSDYRPADQGSFREPYRYTGHDDDSEVGLQYFGARYYMPLLARWASPDPLTIHGLGASLNPYSFVGGSGGIPGLGPGGLWNASWRQFFSEEAAAGRAVTQESLFNQAAQMLGDFEVPYFTPITW